MISNYLIIYLVLNFKVVLSQGGGTFLKVGRPINHEQSCLVMVSLPASGADLTTGGGGGEGE